MHRQRDVNGYVRESDGSITFTAGDITGPSRCDGNSVRVRWFRKGNGYCSKAHDVGGGTFTAGPKPGSLAI